MINELSYKEFEEKRKKYIKCMRDGDERINRFIYKGILKDKVESDLLFLEWVNYKWDKFSVEDKKYIKMLGEMMVLMFRDKVK